MDSVIYSGPTLELLKNGGRSIGILWFMHTTINCPQRLHVFSAVRKGYCI